MILFGTCDSLVVVTPVLVNLMAEKRDIERSISPRHHHSVFSHDIVGTDSIAQHRDAAIDSHAACFDEVVGFPSGTGALFGKKFIDPNPRA